MKTTALFLSALVLVPSAAFGAEEIVAGVVPVSGSASAKLRVRATQTIETSLKGLPGIQVVSFTGAAGLLGSDKTAKISTCIDDPCIREATKLVNTDVLIVPELDLEDSLVLRIRLLDTATTAPPRVRVTKNVTGGETGLGQAISAAITELFPERAKSALGTLEIVADYEGALVFVDGDEVARLDEPPIDGPRRAVLRVQPGTRRIEVRAEGHFPYETEAEVIVGQLSTIEVSLEKNRSNGPVLLAGAGVVAGISAMVFGLSAQTTADQWAENCTFTQCAEGFTRMRYEADEKAVPRFRVLANTMLVVSAATLVGALVWYVLDPGQTPEFTADVESAAMGWSW